MTAVFTLSLDQVIVTEANATFKEAVNEIIKKANSDIITALKAGTSELLGKMKDHSELHKALVMDFADNYQKFGSFNYNKFDSEIVVVDAEESGIEVFLPFSKVIRDLALEESKRLAYCATVQGEYNERSKEQRRLSKKAKESAAEAVAEAMLVDPQGQASASSNNSISKKIHQIVKECLKLQSKSTPKNKGRPRDHQRRESSGMSTPRSPKPKSHTPSRTGQKSPQFRGQSQSPQLFSTKNAKVKQSPGPIPSLRRNSWGRKSDGQTQWQRSGILKNTSHTGVGQQSPSKKRKMSAPQSPTSRSPTWRRPNNAGQSGFFQAKDARYRQTAQSRSPQRGQKHWGGRGGDQAK